MRVPERPLERKTQVRVSPSKFHAVNSPIIPVGESTRNLVTEAVMTNPCFKFWITQILIYPSGRELNPKSIRSDESRMGSSVGLEDRSS